MEERVLAALEASIAKWEKKAAGDHSRYIRNDAQDCPLCQLFNNQPDATKNCRGCPVFEVLIVIGMPS